MEFWVCTTKDDDDEWSQQVFTSPERVITWLIENKDGFVLQWQLDVDTVDAIGDVVGP